MSAPMNQVLQAANRNCIIPPIRVYTLSRLTYCTKESQTINNDRKPKRDRDFDKDSKRIRVDKDGYRILEKVKMPPVSSQFSDLPQTKWAQKVTSVNRKGPRYTTMPVDQDWTNVWPAAHSFKWSAVPLPVRQGQIKSKTEAAGDGLPPTKYGNLELMKIPNFLHLTPAHVKKHCEAIKKYTTPWPTHLDSEETMMKTFPLEIVTSDFCFSGPSIRDKRARIATMKFPLKALKMDEHGEDKFIKLVGDRYNKDTGYVTMAMDRCPLKTQNLEYLMYQLTALYFESTSEEPWEETMTEQDMLQTPWGSENSRKTLEILLSKDPDLKETESFTEIQNLIEKKTRELKEDLVKRTEAKPVTEKVFNYKIASEQLLKGQSEKTDIDNYKQAVLKLLNLNKVADQLNQEQ